MKIAFCHHLSLSYFGGGERWIIETAQELMKRGHEVSIHCLPFSLERKRHFKIKDISYSESFHHTVKADVCYLTFNPLNWLNFNISSPRIAGIHTFAYWAKPNIRYGSLPILAWTTNKFTSYFDLRRFNAVHTINSAFFPNHPYTYIIPNYVDSEKFKPSPKDTEFTVIYASRAIWQKGYETMQSIQKYFEWFGKVKFAGDVPEEEMPQFLSSGHVAINPSIVDTFGLSIVESMMCQTPVITSGIIAHRKLGLPLLYADHIQDYLKEIKHVYNMIQNGSYSEFIEQCREQSLKFDKKIIMNKIEQMFKEVLDGNMVHSEPFRKEEYYREGLPMEELRN